MRRILLVLIAAPHLALAHHSTGDTGQALEIQRQAISLLPPGDSNLRHELERALARFEAAAAADDPE